MNLLKTKNGSLFIQLTHRVQDKKIQDAATLRWLLYDLQTCVGNLLKENESTSFNLWDVLPLDMWNHIYSFLSFPEKTKCRGLHTGWKQFCDKTCLIQVEPKAWASCRQNPYAAWWCPVGRNEILNVMPGAGLLQITRQGGKLYTSESILCKAPRSDDLLINANWIVIRVSSQVKIWRRQENKWQRWADFVVWDNEWNRFFLCDDTLWQATAIKGKDAVQVSATLLVGSQHAQFQFIIQQSFLTLKLQFTRQFAFFFTAQGNRLHERDLVAPWNERLVYRSNSPMSNFSVSADAALLCVILVRHPGQIHILCRRHDHFEIQHLISTAACREMQWYKDTLFVTQGHTTGIQKWRITKKANVTRKRKRVPTNGLID